jgi:pyruvate dehydrogenase E1 component beta subunit
MSEPEHPSYREAAREAIREAMRADERVFLMGEDVGRYGGCYAVSLGLLGEFGERRIRDTPLSELTFVGAAIGAAMAGMRPIVEIMTINFSLLALDQVVNTAAAMRHMSGDQVGVPVVIRMASGGGRQVAAQHSHSLEAWYAHVPGLTVLAPGTVADARWMLAPALADPDPVVIIEHAGLYNVRAPVGEAPPPERTWRAAVRRTGDDVALIAYGGGVRTALAAAEELARDGVAAEVLDLRALRPLDVEAIVGAAVRAGRVVVVDEGWRTLGVSAEIAALITEHAFYDLDAPVARVCGAEVPMPYAGHLERAAIPQAEDVVAAARRLVGAGA